jgi:hypothetical protein
MPGISVDLLDVPAVHQPVVHHRLAAGTAFLGGLEDDHRRAVEVARLAEILGGAQQHRRMPIVAAGVHAPGSLGGVGQPRVLGHGQGVHIGAQADHLARRSFAALDDADHAGPADARHHLVATESFELLGYDAGRAMHLVEDLRMLMEVTSPGRDLILHGGDTVDDGHEQSSGWEKGAGRSGHEWEPLCKEANRLRRVKAGRHTTGQAFAPAPTVATTAMPRFPDG